MPTSQENFETKGKCVALLFICLLAGNEVNAVRPTFNLMEDDDLELNGKRGSALMMNAGAAGAAAALFATVAQRQARVEEVSARLKAWLHAGSESGAVCTSTDWASEREQFRSQADQIKVLAAETRTYIKEKKVVPNKWGIGKAKQLVNLAKTLDHCVDAAEKGMIKNVKLDESFELDLAQGPERIPKSEENPGHYVDRIYGEAMAASMAAVMATKLLTDYRKESKCHLGQGKAEKPLDVAFRQKPECFNDCADLKLNANQFNASVSSSLESCTKDGYKTSPVFVWGSAEWHTCLGRTTKSCTLGNGYEGCCCKTGHLNADYKGVEKRVGCTTQCNPEEAKTQRALQERITLVLEEFNGADCDYSETVGGMHVATKLRSKVEKMYVEKASGHTPTIDEVNHEATADAAESFVELEEAHGSLLDLDTAMDSEIFDIIFLVLVVCLILFLCMAAPDICIFIWILSILNN